MTRLIRPLALLLLGTALLLGAGCGPGVFGAGPAESASLKIATVRIPAAQQDSDYVPTQLAALGARAPVAWSLTSGRLPAGIELSLGGILSGRPQESGLFAFTVRATDGHDLDTSELALAVDTFTVTVQGLHFGDAWSGAPVSLQAYGQTGAVTYEVERNESGGAIDRLEASAGLAVYVPGETAGARDLLVAIDEETGTRSQVEIPVMPHPAAGHVAQFGASDVWYIDFTRRVGGHGLPSDWDHALHAVGLRSSAPISTTTDALANLYVRRAVLSRLNELFGRDPDGTRGRGLPITFPLERPSAGYVAPEPGRWTYATPRHYNVIAVLYSRSTTVVGLAYGDVVTNERVENNTTSLDGGELGAFANAVVNDFNGAWQNYALPADPVHAGDEATLRALLYGGAIEGERAERIRRIANDFADALALVLAHEIGHSLGLEHSGYEAGSVMNYAASIYPGAEYRFAPAHREQLEAILPGPGRIPN